MYEAEWDVRFRRTGFYETHRWKDSGTEYRVEVPVYLVNVIGSPFGPMIEPADFRYPMEPGEGANATSSQPYVKKVNDCRELGQSLNEILEQKIDKENVTPLHAIGFGWPN